MKRTRIGRGAIAHRVKRGGRAADEEQTNTHRTESLRRAL
jgi:hypothetical protein